MDENIALDCKNVHFCCISLINGKKVFVKSVWKGTGIDLLLIFEETSPKIAWTGFLANWEVESKAQDLEVPPEEFFRSTKLALTTAADKFHYDFSEENNEFTWTHVEDVKILYGSVRMTKLPEVPEADIRTSMMDVIIELRKQLEVKTTELKDLQRIYGKCSEEFKEFIEKSNERENVMLSKMVLLLNSKKRHIASLEDGLKVNSSSQNTSMRSIELEQHPVKKSQKDSQDSNASSQEINLLSLPKRQKVAEKPRTRLQLQKDKDEMQTTPEEPSGSNVYDKDTLDLDLIN
ncbi:uncharacterized protein LOC129787831 [Lutzomyia longipalpis]|uniref:uncharacterized protein LOC129787831 n=1 Tax=Lutzomyia longipalpis TaxID=7200 RepID=UPI002483B354|nr:uncharacterized protein LOC129787831 [Lutzomyia longipalpis]